MARPLNRRPTRRSLRPEGRATYGAGMPLRMLVLAVVLAIPSGVPARPAPCPDAQYTLDGAPLGGAVTGDTIEIGTRAGIGAACPFTGAVSRRGTAVSVRWASCPGFTGAVRFKGRILDDCARLTGAVRAKGVRTAVTATRSDCGAGILDAAAPAVPYTATLDSLATHPLPRWFDDAKFGIMIHWGLFDVPAWAETVIDPADWLGGQLVQPPDYGREFFKHIPYVEWYQNTILIDGSPAQQHHVATYGAGFPYENFRPMFEAQASAWSPDTWADAFRAARARYVVLVTKHHDGFALWPTTVTHPTRADWHYARDVVGELGSAVRRRCMRMGLYYSGGFDWSVKVGPVQTSLDALVVMPNTPEYIAYADGQWRELIARYRPALLWNDIGYPTDPLALFATYYNTVPDGVINDRFTLLPGQTHHDYVTPEFTVLTDISTEKFETVRGMGRGFGYNQNETDADLDSGATLVRLLVDVVSKNGNLLLNVGPKADGSIPPEQLGRLQTIGAWLDVNGAAIFGTRPWTRAAGVTADATPVRFTAAADGRTVYAIVLGDVGAGALTLKDLGFAPKAVRLLGAPGRVRASVSGADLILDVRTAPAAAPAHVFALTVR